MLTQRCTACVTRCLMRSQSMGPNAVLLRLPPPRLDSHSVLKACTKVPLYNMCVTKINKHSPSLSVSAPKEKVMQSLAFVPRCPPVLSLSLPRSCSAQETPPRPSSPTGSHVVPVCSEGQSDINCGSDVYLFEFFILISRSQAGGQGANAQIAWGQSAEWLGQGRSFHTQCHAPKKPLATKKGKQGGPVAYTRSRIPEMFSKYLPLIFLGE